MFQWKAGLYSRREGPALCSFPQRTEAAVQMGRKILLYYSTPARKC